MQIRRPDPDELPQITALVRAIVAETYPDVSHTELQRAGAEDWTQGCAYWVWIDRNSTT